MKHRIITCPSQCPAAVEEYNTNINLFILNIQGETEQPKGLWHSISKIQGAAQQGQGELKRVTKPHTHIKIPAPRTDVWLVTVTWLWVTCQPFPMLTLPLLQEPVVVSVTTHPRSWSTIRTEKWTHDYYYFLPSPLLWVTEHNQPLTCLVAW